MIALIIYIFLIIAILLSFSLAKEKKNALLFSFICFTLIAMLRSKMVGVDTLQYYDNYKVIGLSSGGTTTRYEVGFYWMCRILYKINHNPQTLIMVSSIIINLSVFTFIRKHSSNYLLATLIYFFDNLFFSNMNIMRQALAVSVLLLGYSLLRDKKFFKFSLVIIIASLFHTVALVAFLLVLFRLIPKRKWIRLSMIIVMVLLFVFANKLFDVVTKLFGYSNYADSDYSNSNYFGAALTFAIPLLGLGIPLAYIKLFKVDVKEEQNFHFYTVITIAFIGFSALVMRMTIFNRLSGLFNIFALILIPYYLNLIKKRNVTDYKIVTGVVLLVYIVSFVVIIALRPEWTKCVPYEFFWS